jgi:hypothetical protein
MIHWTVKGEGLRFEPKSTNSFFLGQFIAFSVDGILSREKGIFAS